MNDSLSTFILKKWPGLDVGLPLSFPLRFLLDDFDEPMCFQLDTKVSISYNNIISIEMEAEIPRDVAQIINRTYDTLKNALITTVPEDFETIATLGYAMLKTDKSACIALQRFAKVLEQFVASQKECGDDVRTLGQSHAK
jgi:hypothetical protein